MVGSKDVRGVIEDDGGGGKVEGRGGEMRRGEGRGDIEWKGVGSEGGEG